MSLSFIFPEVSNVASLYTNDTTIIKREFISNNISHDTDVFEKYINLTIDESPADFIKEIAGIIGKNSFITSISTETIAIHSNSDPLTLVLLTYNGGNDFFKKTRDGFSLDILSTMDNVLNLLGKIEEHYKDKRLAEVQWWFFGADNKAECRQIAIDVSKPAYDELYPFIEEGVDEYQKQYLEDESSLLFLMGPPGTGKTSFIRNMLFKNKLKAVVTYEEKILLSDSLFVDFFTGDKDIMIIEDADLILQSREEFGNKAIARFLNMGDGLIKFKGKKIIFTSNLRDFSQIDQALIREGRCFGAIKFRPLTLNEASKACDKLGITLPSYKWPENQGITLAELVNKKNKKEMFKKKIGFNHD